jgi:hypothetical protein
MLEIGVGPSAELRLRVSAAALVRVTFTHPENGREMLALERKATLLAEGGAVTVSAQPFGGGSRILQAERLRDEIGDFHFDSERSRSEKDFRILIRPEDWQAVKACCLRHFRADESDVIEAGAARELAEEFGAALKVEPAAADYRLKAVGMVCENLPTPTDNLHGAGLPTARIYRLFAAELTSAGLIERVLESSTGISDEQLERLAHEEARAGGKGRANAALVLDLERLTDFYQGLPGEQRSAAVKVDGHALSANVAALLSEVSVPRYERVET